MPQEVRQNELQEKTQQLLQGPLQHVRMAALAAALLPLASVAAAPASAQNVCMASGAPAPNSLCGFVWNDADNDGEQDAGESVIEGAKVYVDVGTETIVLETDIDGQYILNVFDYPADSYTISVLIPDGTQPSPINSPSTTDTLDSDGQLIGAFSVATVPNTDVGFATDFGFYTSLVQGPGTGTPGYWKNHPEAWPVANITVGGVSYTKAQAIARLGKVGKDKANTMFSSLVSAILNVMIHNEDSCVSATIAAAHTWMAAHPSNVAASSDAWAEGEPLHQLMDSYNNGLLCAPHRN
jgi:hypothetical protein